MKDDKVCDDGSVKVKLHETVFNRSDELSRGCYDPQNVEKAMQNGFDEVKHDSLS